MKKRDLKKMALLGLTGGIILTQSSLLADTNSEKNGSKSAASTSKEKEYDPNGENLGYHLMTEDELLLELNADGQRMFKSMDAANKQLVLKVASARCNFTNECKGLNACKTDKNDCAGKGSCRGTGKCALSDKNLAVKLVYDKMQKKRMGANSGQ